MSAMQVGYASQSRVQPRELVLEPGLGGRVWREPPQRVVPRLLLSQLKRAGQLPQQRGDRRIGLLTCDL